MSKKCRLCGDETKWVLNIRFKAVPVCNRCSASVMQQHMAWLCENRASELVESQQQQPTKQVQNAVENDAGPYWGNSTSPVA